MKNKIKALTLLLIISISYSQTPQWEKGTGDNIYINFDEINGPEATISIGTSDHTKTLTVKGEIYTEGLIVNSTWSDYVFEANYELWPLKKVEKYIKANKHLPNIPSAKEVQAEGVSLGEMQARILAKVEELTLHIINQQETIDSLKTEIGGVE